MFYGCERGDLDPDDRDSGTKALVVCLLLSSHILFFFPPLLSFPSYHRLLYFLLPCLFITPCQARHDLHLHHIFFLTSVSAAVFVILSWPRSPTPFTPERSTESRLDCCSLGSRQPSPWPVGVRLSWAAPVLFSSRILSISLPSLSSPSILHPAGSRQRNRHISSSLSIPLAHQFAPASTRHDAFSDFPSDSCLSRRWHWQGKLPGSDGLATGLRASASCS